MSMSVQWNAARFMWSHPAHVLAMGFGSGLSPKAPGTVGTLWAWASFDLMTLFMSATDIGLLIALSLPIGWWACTVTAQHMQVQDPSAIVWDGQTVALGGLIAEDNVKSRDKVPVLGDVPVLGRLFRSENSRTVKKNLMIFVTATIVDAAGKRVHDPENLPMDPKTTPPRSMSNQTAF